MKIKIVKYEFLYLFIIFLLLHDSVNEFSASVSAPSAMSVAHHVYITDGLLFTTDMIRCLEIISNSSIVFSFISYGMNNAHAAGNIGSGFGYVTDHHLMEFLATITNGFYAFIDENLNFSYVRNKSVLLYPSLCLPNFKSNTNVASARVKFNAFIK